MPNPPSYTVVSEFLAAVDLKFFQRAFRPGSPGHKANHARLGDANSGGFEPRRLDRNASSGQSCGKKQQKSLGVGLSLTMISKANGTFLDPKMLTLKNLSKFMHLDHTSSRNLQPRRSESNSL